MHGVRAIACLGVVISHAKFVLWSGGQAYMERYPMAHWDWHEFPVFFLDLITSLGPTRVFFFFILSGFFLQYSTRKDFSIRFFAQNRFLRLYPAYLFATLMALGIFYTTLTHINPQLTTGSAREFNTLLSRASSDVSWAALGHTLLFMKRDAAFAASAHFWSMLHEVVFCFLFPLYRLLSVRGRGVAALVVLMGSWLSGNILLQAQFFFLIGMLFYDFFSRGYRLPWRLPRGAYFAAFVCLYLATYLAGRVGTLWLASLPMLVLAFLLFEFFLTQTVQVPKMLVTISKASYAIYLNHMWALLLYYAILSRLTGELVFYSRWPYYSGVVVAILLSGPAYWLVDKRVGAYLGRLKAQSVAITRILSVDEITPQKQIA